MFLNFLFILKLYLFGVFGCFLVFKVYECVLYLVYVFILNIFLVWSVVYISIDFQFFGFFYQFWDLVFGFFNKYSCGQGYVFLIRCIKGGIY